VLDPALLKAEIERGKREKPSRNLPGPSTTNRRRQRRASSSESDGYVARLVEKMISIQNGNKIKET